jgi:hypothetical protein
MWYDENDHVSLLVQLIKYETRCYLQPMKLFTVMTKANWRSKSSGKERSPMDGGGNNAQGLGQGLSNPTLGHKSLLMDLALQKYPSKLDGLNHTNQGYSLGTILVARSVWELCFGILRSIILCSLLNILRPYSGLPHQAVNTWWQSAISQKKGYF